MIDDILECFPIEITDDLLSKAKIAAWMFNQEFKNSEGKIKPFTPKAFPLKAIDIFLEVENGVIEIYLKSDDGMWNSRAVIDGRFGKLTPEQMDSFFCSKFYKKMVGVLKNKWPLLDPAYSKLFDAINSMCVSTDVSQEELQEIEGTDYAIDEVDQTEKRPDLANQDTTGDGKRDYSGTGRKIQHFSDMGVKGGSGRYYCWPKKGKEFKWNSWKDWKKLKPFCKMTFSHNGRQYMISLSLFDEQFDNRGFRGADTQWTPPLAWLTHEECSQVLQLSIVRKFLKQCQKKINGYLNMTPEEVLEKIDKPERVTIKEIEKTQRVIKHCIKVAFGEKQADNYHYDKHSLES